jgi:transcriptional regulator with XRE-family HTH domain
MTKATSAPLSYEAAVTLEGLGKALKTSRLARRDTIAKAAGRIGVASSTWQRIEAGDPGIGSGVLLSALVTYGYSDVLMNLADERHDAEGQRLLRQSLPGRGVS